MLRSRQLSSSRGVVLAVAAVVEVAGVTAGLEGDTVGECGVRGVALSTAGAAGRGSWAGIGTMGAAGGGRWAATGMT